MVHDIEYESYPLYLTIRLDSTYPNFAVALNMFIHFDLSNKYIYIYMYMHLYLSYVHVWKYTKFVNTYLTSQLAI